MPKCLRRIIRDWTRSAARFTDLRQWVIDLDEFDDSREGSTEAKLEAIQMAWHEIYKEQNEEDSE